MNIAPSPQGVLAGVKVLCVDDQPDALNLLALVLRRAGAVVTAQPSAELAIECLRDNVFDVLISDLQMPPGIDGYDLVHALRKMEKDDSSRLETPTLALSSDALKQSSKKRFADFQVYMAKPFDFKHLVNIVERLAEADGESVKYGSLAAWEQDNQGEGLRPD
ncbi:MAG: response regulator [Proteobacteria bacterium]|nr:response regulator [Pseudomonadota bacterium]